LVLTLAAGAGDAASAPETASALHTSTASLAAGRISLQRITDQASARHLKFR
jgi:hypothetical protein